VIEHSFAAKQCASIGSLTNNSTKHKIKQLSINLKNGWAEYVGKTTSNGKQYDL
jgi:hypothetical protein